MDDLVFGKRLSKKKKPEAGWLSQKQLLESRGLGPICRGLRFVRMVLHLGLTLHMALNATQIAVNAP